MCHYILDSGNTAAYADSEQERIAYLKKKKTVALFKSWHIGHSDTAP